MSPTCAPTRASLLTGRHEFRCGITHVKKGRSILNGDNVTLAEVLSQAGYRTGIFGKWHLGSNYPSRPEDRGFEETFYFGGSHLGCTGDYWGNSKFDPVVRHNGKLEKTEGYSVEVFFNQALKWIRKDVEDPFFAYIATCVPHHPYQAPDEYRQIYQNKGLEEEVSHFYGMISKLDEAFGNFMGQIDETGLSDNTFILFMTDNGSVFSQVFNAGMRGGKTNTYEGGTRVPAFFRFPGRFEQNRDIQILAGAKDIFPTVLALCDIPRDERYKLEGRSLLPLLEGKKTEWDERSIVAHLGFWNSDEDVQKYKLLRTSVRTQQYRLVNEAEIENVFSNPKIQPQHLTSDNWELHDIENDLGENCNIKSQQAERAKMMKKEFDHWWDSVSEELGEVVFIVIGTPYENPTTLTCFDWYPSIDFPGLADCSTAMPETVQSVVDWLNSGSQSDVLNDVLLGSWNVEVKTKGRYRITPRILPEEAKEIVCLKPGKAFMKFGEAEYELAVDSNHSSVSFEAELHKGQARLECWFSEQLPNNRLLGAFYVDVEFMG